MCPSLWWGESVDFSGANVGQVIWAFAVAWWLGLYLLVRNTSSAVPRLAGAGLLSYGVALALNAASLPGALGTIADGALLLPAALWVPALVQLVRAYRAHPRPDRARGLIVVAVLLVALAIGLVIAGLGWVPYWLAALSIGFDLALLGVCVARFDAFDEGETVRADMLRSALLSGGVALLFGSQIGLALLVTGPRPDLQLLLYGVVASAIGVVVLTSPLQALADRVALTPAARTARTELREVADALPRKAEVPLPLNEAEFVRHVRRALSNYGDLGKLVTSPLTELPLIDTRLAERGAEDTPVERARELKAVLLESIERLKPADGEFGTSEEWRHYNALYFYYVGGIRPYSVRTKRTDLDPISRRALSWFADQVPERTLHNWQSAAAKLVATDLGSSIARR